MVYPWGFVGTSISSSQLGRASQRRVGEGSGERQGTRSVETSGIGKKFTAEEFAFLWSSRQVMRARGCPPPVWQVLVGHMPARPPSARGILPAAFRSAGFRICATVPTWTTKDARELITRLHTPDLAADQNVRAPPTPGGGQLPSTQDPNPVLGYIRSLFS